MDGQGLYLSIYISYRKFLGDESSKQVAYILNDKDPECVKCFLTHVRRTLGDFSNDDCEIFNEKMLFI